MLNGRALYIPPLYSSEAFKYFSIHLSFFFLFSPVPLCLYASLCTLTNLILFFFFFLIFLSSPLFPGFQCFQKYTSKLTTLKWNNFLGRKSKILEFVVLMITFQCTCVSTLLGFWFSNDRDSFVVFFHFESLELIWVCVMFLKRCIKSK